MRSCWGHILGGYVDGRKSGRISGANASDKTSKAEVVQAGAASHPSERPQADGEEVLSVAKKTSDKNVQCRGSPGRGEMNWRP